jgi:hypothetical protein
MNGLMEQIKPENKRLYNTYGWQIGAYQTMASNLRHLLMQQGKLTMEEFVKLTKLIESEDLESVKLSITLMETMTGEIFIM